MAMHFYLVAQPVISGFSPATGPVGSTVTINGNNFSATPSNNTVYFGAVKAPVTAASATSLSVTVPPGASYTPVSVTTGGLTAFSRNPFIVTYTGGVAISSASFAPQLDFTTGIRPNDIAAADFDGDGKADIATPNNFSTAGFASISVLRNTSSSPTISFAAKQDFTTGAVTYAIAVGDVDGDGKPDIVSASVADGTLSVFRNTSSTGSISFAPKVDLSGLSAPFAIVVADLDTDGRTDLAVINSTGNQLSVFRNTGSPGTISFASKTDFPTLLSPQDLVASDFDGDGKTDLAFTNKLSGSFSIYRNTGSPGTLSFATLSSLNLTAGNEPYGLSAGDLDGDGKPDLAIAYNNSGGGGIITYRNNSTSGNLAWLAGPGFASGASANSCYHVAINEINGDGKPDLAMTIAGSTGFTRLYQNSSTPGSIGLASAANISASFAPYGAVIADLDNDSKADLGISEFTMEKVSVYRNKTGEPIINSFTPTQGGNGATITINGDYFTGATAVSFGGTPASSFSVNSQFQIVATVGTGSSGEVAVTTPKGTGTLPGFTYAGLPTIGSFNPASAATGTTVTISGSNFTGVSAVSFGGVAATSYTVVNATTITAVVAGGASGNISVTTTFGTASLGGFTYLPAPVISSFTPTTGGAGTVISITGSNFNGVTALSIGGVPAASYTVNSPTSISATTGEGATGTIKVTANGGTGTSGNNFSFTPPTISFYAPQSGPVGTSVTINGANFRSTPSAHAVYFGATRATVNNATPTSLSVTVPPGATYGPVSVTVNNHTVLGAPYFRTTFTEPGTGIATNSFGFAGSFASAEDSRLIQLADIDGDGKADLLTGNYNARTLNVQRNTGSASFNFAAPVQVASGLGTSFYFTTGDLNSDGKTDIAIAGNSSIVTVLINTSSGGTIAFSTTTYATPDFCRGITLGDFDGDGRLDMAVTSGSIFTPSYYICTFRNNGYNGAVSFDTRQDRTVPGVPWDISASDFDGDGKDDIAVGFGIGLNVLRNTSSAGNISFGSLQNLENTGTHYVIARGDADGDNKPDIITILYNTDKVSVYRNTSNPGVISFAPVTLVNGQSSSAIVRIGQLDGDGRPDLIIVPTNDKKVYLKRNTSSSGSIAFDANVTVAMTPATLWTSDVAIGDLDMDGKDDFVVANGPDNKVSLFQNHIGWPSIASFAPGSAGTGATVTITGSNFTGANTVKFGNVPAASFTVQNANTINAVVGTGASGYVYVSTPAGADSLAGFTFLAPPAISSFTPQTGPTGATITISGTNFTGTTAVSFGGTAATSFTVVNATTITAIVGSGTSGNVNVTTPAGNASLGGFIYIPAPNITAFAPASGTAGTVVTITGTNFTGATAVSFGGTSASSFTVVNATTITAVVGSGTTGSVSVTTPGGNASLGGFTFSPVTAVINPGSVNPPELTIQPNPGAAIITIRHPRAANGASMQLLGYNGQLQKEWIPVRNSTYTTVDISGLPGGLYFLVWRDKDRLLLRYFMKH